MAVTVDLAVIGGGVNGCGIARDAAGRGLSVYLCEKGDLASGTSSTSTKMIHGGLRYLEHCAFRLVRESLIEREILWRAAPHIAEPLRIVLPHHTGLRPAWLIRLGLWLYDHIGGRKLLPPTASVDLGSDPVGAPLVAGFTRAFEYSDCWVDDARLVALNAVHAAELGARVETRTEAVALRCEAGIWHLTVRAADGSTQDITARAVVNAAGPWVARVLKGTAQRESRSSVRLVRGSHIVVPRLHHDPRGFLFQNADGRVMFVLPYEDDFSLIGTTDIDHAGDPDGVAVEEDEVAYLCDAVSAYLKTPVSPDDVVHSFAGLRPLYDDGSSAAQEATRDYVFELDTDAGAPLLSIFGGKITTYRRLSLEAIERLAPHLGALGAPWTQDTPLPGGDFPVRGRAALTAAAVNRYSDLDPGIVARLIRQYGTRIHRLLDGVSAPEGLGRDFGHGLYQVEVDYLLDTEFATTADDILWRRTKLGLRFETDQVHALAAYCARRSACAPERVRAAS
ncbi:MAG: glycerol-3-phosphate dehydrogenase [Pseudomonadota bacterium]